MLVRGCILESCREARKLLVVGGRDGGSRRADGVEELIDRGALVVLLLQAVHPAKGLGMAGEAGGRTTGRTGVWRARAWMDDEENEEGKAEPVTAPASVCLSFSSSPTSKSKSACGASDCAQKRPFLIGFRAGLSLSVPGNPVPERPGAREALTPDIGRPPTPAHAQISGWLLVYPRVGRVQTPQARWGHGTNDSRDTYKASARERSSTAHSAGDALCFSTTKCINTSRYAIVGNAISVVYMIYVRLGRVLVQSASCMTTWRIWWCLR